MFWVGTRPVSLSSQSLEAVFKTTRSAGRALFFRGLAFANASPQALSLEPSVASGIINIYRGCWLITHGRRARSPQEDHVAPHCWRNALHIPHICTRSFLKKSHSLLRDQQIFVSFNFVITTSKQISYACGQVMEFFRQIDLVFRRWNATGNEHHIIEFFCRSGREMFWYGTKLYERLRWWKKRAQSGNFQWGAA